MIPLVKRFDDFTIEDIWFFMRNILVEKDLPIFTEQEVKQLMNLNYGFGNIVSKPTYWKKVYCEPLWRAIKEAKTRFPEERRVLDVGCGLGTQALLFSLMPSVVHGMDYSVDQLDVAKKRVEHYSSVVGRPLDIELEQADVTKCKFEEFGQFDVVYSHGCIGKKLTADEVFDRLNPAVVPGGIVILKNSNPSYIPVKLLKQESDLSGPDEYRAAAVKHGFKVATVRGTTSIPRPLWVAGAASACPDILLKHFLSTQVHLEMIFEKQK